MEPPAQPASTPSQAGPVKQRRTYRACEHCRLRKLKCDLGDPESPSEGPCRRCRRESRPCILQYSGSVRAQGPVGAKPYSRSSPQSPGNSTPSSASSLVPEGYDPTHPFTTTPLSAPAPAPIPLPPPPPLPRNVPHIATRPSRADSAEPERDGDGEDNEDILLSSKLHNPSDALRLLAHASAQRERHEKIEMPPSLAPPVCNEECWKNWGPVADGVLDQREAEALFLFFQLEMAPLYPLLPPNLFLPSHLPTLTHTESLLLLSIVSISARYSPLLINIPGGRSDRGTEIHHLLARRIRASLGRMMDGDARLRHISSVEALLLLSEWPMLPEREEGEDGEQGSREGRGEMSEDGEERSDPSLVQISNRYDSVSWGYIGWAVRLAQELGIHNHSTYPGQIEPGAKLPHPWDPERSMRTFIYCYNADRHVSVRLGRDSVVQPYLSSQWWEEVTGRAPGSSRTSSEDVWIQYAVSQGLTAALMGTIQERLFSNVEITRAMLRTGQWESFLRSLEAELATMRRNAHAILSEGDLSATLVKIEFDYVLLYGNAVTLRALQERLKRRLKAKDAHFQAPSILNLQEGRWIIDALEAASSILQQTVSVLEPKGYLRLCPARIFQRILFSAVFLFKSLAVGVVEHGQTTLLGLLDQAISALSRTSIDENHLSRGFAALLGHLQAQCKPRLLSTLLPSRAPPPPSAPPPPAVHPQQDSSHLAAQLYPTSSMAPTPALTAPLHQPLPSLSNLYPPLPSSLQPLPSHHFSHSPASYLSHPPPPQQQQLPQPPPSQFPWDWDPTSELIAVGREQDLLFQSLWADSTMLGGGGEFHLLGTLMGDGFGTGDGGFGGNEF